MRKQNEGAVLLTVLAEEITEEGRYVLCDLTLWKSRKRLIYAEKGGDASFAVLSGPLTVEEGAFLSLVARGSLSPLHLEDVIEDATLSIL